MAGRLAHCCPACKVRQHRRGHSCAEVAPEVLWSPAMTRHALFAALVVAAVAASCKSKSDDKPAAHKPAAHKPKPTAPVSKRKGQPPLAARRPVTNVYHGTNVVDDYQWLEKWSEPKVQAWAKAQDRYTRKRLAALPHVAALTKRVTKVLSTQSVAYGAIVESTMGTFLALEEQPPKKQRFLVQLSSLRQPLGERVIVDPNALDPSGGTSIDFFRPSPDGKLVAVSLSKGGSETGDVHIFDVASGKQVPGVVPRVNGGTAGGDLVWRPDGKGFFYTRYPRGNERPAKDRNLYTQVYYHELGKPTAEDRYELGKDFPRIAEIDLTMHKPTGRLLAAVQKGDGGEFAHFLRSAKGKWRQLTKFGDRHIQVVFGPGTDLFVLSRKGAEHGKLMRMPESGKVADAVQVIADGKDTIVSSFWRAPSIIFTASRLIVKYQVGGPSELRVFDLNGKRLPGPELLPTSSVGGMSVTSAGTVIYANESFTSPPAYWVFDPKTSKSQATALVEKPPVDLSKVLVKRVLATSKDGTEVPVNILIPTGTKLDGSAPAMVTGYGGYGISLTPHYRASFGLLLEQGIICAVVNLRGGGEFGERWHSQGNLTHKQNVFDDFAAALKLMADKNYSSPSHIVIQGGSNGGLLMGATMIQHPTLMKAVVSHVGIYDMLRVKLSANGAFNVTEYGTVKKPDQFKALYAYSPYHHIKDGVSYPPVFLLTGANDPRVDPMQSRKFAARLEAANPRNQVLLRLSMNTGHGRGTPLDEHISQTTDVMAFILAQLGRPFLVRK